MSQYLNKIAERITERLFTNGFDMKAKRLVLEMPDKSDGGGWCREAVRDQVANELIQVVTFYQQRMDALQDYQKTLPDPIRQDVCDILANGYVGTRSAV